MIDDCSSDSSSSGAQLAKVVFVLDNFGEFFEESSLWNLFVEGIDSVGLISTGTGAEKTREEVDDEGETSSVRCRFCTGLSFSPSGQARSSGESLLF